MLRSLVGSEMCIRDSHHIGHTEHPERPQARRESVEDWAEEWDIKWEKHLGPLTHNFKPCLLYTSDAADDLLCVDLGGRRIIKKKKQNKTYMSKNKTLVQPGSYATCKIPCIQLLTHLTLLPPHDSYTTK